MGDMMRRGLWSALLGAAEEKKFVDMQLGLVTYLWGKDMDLPTLIDACEKSQLGGVELRVDHKHGVSPALDKAQRADVKARFEATDVTLIGMGTNEHFDDPEPEKLKQNIDNAKAFIRLSHDIGGSGVKVKPNSFHKDVPHEKTIAQIGKALAEIGEFGGGFGQQIRLEVHGTCCELPTIKAIMEAADHWNVKVCWNSNPEDLQGDGLEANFAMVKKWLGDTCHVREFNVGDYPYPKLMNLFIDAEWAGWILLECRTDPKDKIAAMIEQRKIWMKMVGLG
ncbi:MAG: TIM barrel protein [Phycisphaera sp.]|nr:TIM barrel protein [Phycisphaera sp.]